MKPSLYLSAADLTKKALAVITTFLVFNGIVRADTSVVAGPPIVIPSSVTAQPGRPIPPPAFHDTTINGTFTFIPTAPTEWAITDDPKSGLSIALSPAGEFLAPVASTVVPLSVGQYDTTVGGQMGCTVSVVEIGDNQNGDLITCPLVSTVLPTWNSGEQTCVLPAVDFESQSTPLPMVANSICLLSSVATYSQHYFQCGVNTRGIYDPSTNTVNYEPYCDAVTIKFPIILQASDHNKSGKILKDSLNIQIRDGANTNGANFTATYYQVTAITNPDQLGWIKPAKKPANNSCGHGVNMMTLFDSCHESKTMQLVQTILVGAAVLIVGGFAGPILSGTAGEILAGTEVTRFLVMDSDVGADIVGWTPFLG